MSWLHDRLTRALHGLDPEDAHTLALKGMSLGLGPVARADDPILASSLAGLPVPNCVGLAAGFDKNAEAPDALLRAGFGFVEVGAVTPRPQPGNPRPRLFRLTEDQAVINRMGFNNQGLEAAAGRLARRPRRGVVGVNIGANKDAEDRIADYVAVLRGLWALADYFTVNISSPNTPGLRTLQSGEALDELLERVAEARDTLRPANDRPVFLKVAPDLAEADVETIAQAALRHGLDGLIVSNTTFSRPDDLRSAFRGEAGGLSGRPLRPMAGRVLRQFREVTGGRLTLVAAGGVSDGADAYERIRAGASAVQLYSALVFEGPGLVQRIKVDLAARLRADGFVTVSDAVGTA
jgi:dihydroorotate dehydrogenase